MAKPIQPEVGDSFYDTARKAAGVALLSGKDAPFLSNGTRYVVTARDVLLLGLDGAAAKVSNAYDAARAARVAAYKASPAYALKQLRLQQEQQKLDIMVQQLPQIIPQGEIALMHWLVAYCNIDTESVESRQASTVVALLVAAGYQYDAAINLPQTDYNQQAIAGQYIIGQAIRGLQDDSLIIVNVFTCMAEDYFTKFES